jgi:hypothetical protein
MNGDASTGLQVDMYRLILRSVGNPDLGQNPWQPISPTEKIMVSKLQNAAEAARAYIVRHDLGSGNFPIVRVLEDDRVVARITYNGRVWLPPDGGWNDGDPDDWRRWREAPA